MLRLPDVLADAFQQVHGYDAPGWAKRPGRYTTWGGGGQVGVQPSPLMQVGLNSTLFHGLQQRSSLERLLQRLTGAIDTLCSVRSCAQELPQYANAYERATNEQLTFNNALSASWLPRTWLPLTVVAGLNMTTGHDMTLLSRNIVLGSATSCTEEGVGCDSLGRYGVSQKSATLKTLDVNTKIPGWRNQLTTALGFNLYALNSSDLVSHQDTLALGVTTPATLSGLGQQSVSNTVTYGWFFEPRATLGERFFLTPGFRLDGGNANGGNASVAGLPSKLSFAALFPKVNFSWIALDRQSGEAPPLFGMLTFLRPRLALGSAGVQPTPDAKLRLIGALRDSSALSNGSDLLAVRTLGNTQLKPERSVEIEGGIDVEAWHNRASLQLTRARKTQHDAIIPVPVAPSVYGDGVSVSLNIGEVRNTNTELSASVRPLETQLVTWTIGGNFSHNTNKVLRLNRNSLGLRATDEVLQDKPGDGVLLGTDLVIKAGYPLFSRWARPIAGYVDANGDGLVQLSEIRLGDTAVYVGRQDPASTAAFTTDLSLFRGRLGLHANFSYTGSYSQLNEASFRGRSFLNTANDTGATPGQQAAYVAALNGLTYYSLAQTVSAWRFKDVSLNYAVPAAVARLFRAQHMSVALQGSNLWLWTNYRGKDPNVNAFASGNATADAGQLPEPRTWSLQVTLGN
jgi:hypothetical protein